MGGQVYLTRLAFGRSAYESVRVAEPDERPSGSATQHSQDGNYLQKYDSKGNPTNSRAVCRTEAQIAAKNEVLAAVGVCEKKNNEERQSRAKVTLSTEEWQKINEDETSIGEAGRIVAECARHASSWWLIALRKRIQAGIIDCNQPFSQILRQEWRVMTSSSFRGALGYLMVGAAPELAGQALALVLEYLIEELHLKLCELPFRLRLRRQHRQRMLRWIDRLNLGILIASQLVLSPLAISAALQQLGLLSSIPVASLLPWKDSSPLRWAWTDRADPSPFGSQTLSMLLSPASLWSFSNVLYQTLAISYGATPFCPEQLIMGPLDDIRKSSPFDGWSSKDTPKLLAPITRLRDFTVEKLGWSKTIQEKEEEDGDDSTDLSGERNRNDDPLNRNRRLTTSPRNKKSRTGRSPKRPHRTTELSRFPSYFLALNLDSLLNQLVFLPLESLFLRSLVSCFLAGPLPPRQRPDSHLQNRYSPGKGGPLRALLSRDVGFADWCRAGNYASKLGLCMGLQFGLDSVIWGFAYAWTRWIGVNRFHWGEV